MCKNRKDNLCLINNSRCPWSQWCGHLHVWKERSGAEKYCKLLKDEPVPQGFYKVEFERHGFLYIKYNNVTIKVLNPFDDVPKFVKVKKTKTSYKLTK